MPDWLSDLIQTSMIAVGCYLMGHARGQKAERREHKTDSQREGS